MSKLRHIYLPNRPGQKAYRRLKGDAKLKHHRQWYAFKTADIKETPEQIRASLEKLV